METVVPSSPATVVVDSRNSPHARLRPTAVGSVRLADMFWQPRRDANRQATLLSQHRQCEETGRLDNFRRVAGKSTKPFQGIFFNDSDIYKWLEAASWAMADDSAISELADMVADVIRTVAEAQQPDGYLNTYFSLERAGERWTNLRDMHELYCAGHLFQAAVAHYRATATATLLDVATRFADYLCDYFGPADSGRHAGTCGHEEVEMALVELYRVTGNTRYLDLATYFVGARGAVPSALTKLGLNDDFDRRYAQDHVPYHLLVEATGHAVRMIYLACGAADVWAETGDATLQNALETQWANMTQRRMYVTGGLGARWEGEAFGADYELPSDRAYTETCAAIGSVMWNWRMLLVTGDAKYADVLELALYNAVLPGLSLDSEHYFYQNPLADDGGHRRQAWFGCACCPPNVARLLAQLPGYFYALDESGIYVNLYAAGSAALTLADGRAVRLTQSTRYPWDGEIAITVEAQGEFSLFLRIPNWVEHAVTIETSPPAEPLLLPASSSGRYVEIRREWQPGDIVRLSLPMTPRRLISHPAVADTRNCIAMMRGPLVYCFEHADNSNLDVRRLAMPESTSLSPTWEPDLLEGVVVLRGEMMQKGGGDWDGTLYRSADAPSELTTSTVSATAIPYYAWANRAAGPMRVWIPKTG